MEGRKQFDDDKKAIIDIDLGFFEYHAKYDKDDNYIIDWEINWVWICVVVFWIWLIFTI